MDEPDPAHARDPDRHPSQSQPPRALGRPYARRTLYVRRRRRHRGPDVRKDTAILQAHDERLEPVVDRRRVRRQLPLLAAIYARAHGLCRVRRRRLLAGRLRDGQHGLALRRGHERIPLPGLVTYDFATRAWANESISAAYSTGGGAPGGGLRDHYPSGGEALCLSDVGGAGVVMFVGDRGYSANGQTPVPLPFEDVLFYDIASKSFHWQKTTPADSGAAGGVPRDRRDGCTAIAKGKHGTYEV